MILKCFQKNDTFTVNNIIAGNGQLDYGIGLITSDEVVLTGGWNSSNLSYYLYNGQNFWTMTPRYFDGSSAILRSVISFGSANYNNHVNDNIGVKPVINLKPNSLKLGDGTINNPYMVTSE